MIFKLKSKLPSKIGTIYVSRYPVSIDIPEYYPDRYRGKEFAYRK